MYTAVRNPHDEVGHTSLLCEFHWLPDKFGIQFKSRCSCTKSPPNDVRRTLPTSSPSARQTHSDDLCVQYRPVQPSSDQHALLSDHVHSLSAVQTFGSLPPSLRTITSHPAFRQVLKTHFHKTAVFSPPAMHAR